MSLRGRALEMYVDGGNFRRIARHLKVNHQTVANWVTEHVEALLEAPVPEEVQEAEMENCSHSSAVKNGIYILTLVDRGAFLAARTRLLVPCAYLSIHLIDVNFTNNATQLMLLM